MATFLEVCVLPPYGHAHKSFLMSIILLLSFEGQNVTNVGFSQETFITLFCKWRGGDKMGVVGSALGLFSEFQKLLCILTYAFFFLSNSPLCPNPPPQIMPPALYPSYVSQQYIGQSVASRAFALHSILSSFPHSCPPPLLFPVSGIMRSLTVPALSLAVGVPLR